MPLMRLKPGSQHLDLLADSTGADSHVLGVEFHVARLDALG